MANESTRTGETHELVLARTIDAPREVLFDVWTQAEHFAQWFGPRDVELPFCKIDPRPGGILHFCHRRRDGTEVWVKGTYREVVAPERLVFGLGFVDATGRTAAHPMFRPASVPGAAAGRRERCVPPHARGRAARMGRDPGPARRACGHNVLSWGLSGSDQRPLSISALTPASASCVSTSVSAALPATGTSITASP